MMMFETLETRRLLAGVTLLTHGYQGEISGWIKEAARDIENRAGGSAKASIYTMKVKKVDGKPKVTSFLPDSGYSDYRSNASAELIIRLDWTDVDAGSFSTGKVASAVADYFLAPPSDQNLPPIAELPMHLIGHSRGASLVAELARYLGRRGIVVDQTTFLDPAPTDGRNDLFGANFGDAPMTVWNNVVFADNYWRTDGNSQNFDPDGEPVAGTYQGDLNNSVQRAFFISAHNAVTAYYDGTIDLNGSNGGDHPILGSWYGGSNPARDKTGFAFSRIGGSTRPASGVGPLAGGTASRKLTGSSGTQWPNALEIKPVGGTEFTAGSTFNVSVRVADLDSSADVSIYLDTDGNPYNSPGTKVRGATVPGGVIGQHTFSVNTAGMIAGTYKLAVKTNDAGGRTRWLYGGVITLAPGPQIGAIANRVLVITGSAGKDTISVTPGGSGKVVAAMGGFSSIYDTKNFDRVEVDCGAGDDVFTSSNDFTKPIYVFGGAGNDTLTGGGGADTLSGGAGKNRMDGGDGADRVNGSGAPDTILGGAGDDRLYGNGGDDLIDGGGGVNRIFGGDGSDSLIGGNSADKLYGEAGNDTLIGKGGADLLNGGPGTDFADEDSSDTRTSIEELL